MGWEDYLDEQDLQERKYGVIGDYTSGYSLSPGSGYFSIAPAFLKSERFLPSEIAKWRTKDDFYAAIKTLMEHGDLVDLDKNYYVNDGQKASDADVNYMFEEMRRGKVLLVDNTTPEKLLIYHMKLTEPLFDKETKEPNPSADISYTPYPLSEKQYEMLKMSPEDAQKGLDSLGDPPQEKEALREYNYKRRAYNEVIERAKEIAAKFPAADKETKAEEKAEVKEEPKTEAKENVEVKEDPKTEAKENVEVKEEPKTEKAANKVEEAAEIKSDDLQTRLDAFLKISKDMENGKFASEKYAEPLKTAAAQGFLYNANGAVKPNALEGKSSDELAKAAFYLVDPRLQEGTPAPDGAKIYTVSAEQSNGEIRSKADPKSYNDIVRGFLKETLPESEEALAKEQEALKKEQSALKRPRRGFWGTARDIIFGKNNAGRRAYNEKVREYNEKFNNLDNEIKSYDGRIQIAKNKLDKLENAYNTRQASDDTTMRQFEVIDANAKFALEQSFPGVNLKYNELLLDKGMAKSYVESAVYGVAGNEKDSENIYIDPNDLKPAAKEQEAPAQLSENVKTEPEKVQSEPEKEGLDPAYFNKDDREELRSQIAGMGFDVNNQRPREEEYTEFKDGETKHFETAADLNPNKEEVQIPETEVKENVKTEPENKVADNVPVPEVKEAPKPEETSRTAKAHYNRIDIINRQANKAMKQISEKYTDESGKISKADEKYLQELDNILRKDTPEAEKMRNIFGVLDKTAFDYFKKEFADNPHNLESELNNYMNNNSYQAKVAEDIQRELREREKNTNPDADIVFKR